MPSFVSTSGLTEIAKRLAEMQARTRPGSRVRAELMKDVRTLTLQAHDKTLQAGLDADGSATAPLKPSTLARRHGSGPPRIPTASSRFLTARAFEWQESGGRITGTLAYKGVPWVRYHITGTRRMAARPPGVAPQMMGPIRERFARLPQDIARRGGGA